MYHYYYVNSGERNMALIALVALTHDEIETIKGRFIAIVGHLMATNLIYFGTTRRENIMQQCHSILD